MSYDTEVALLVEYQTWLAEQQYKAKDLTPETFLIERAKDAAMEALIKIQDAHDLFTQEIWENADEARMKFIITVAKVLEDV